MTPSPTGSAAWKADLVGRLQVFVDSWRSYAGTEKAGAQDFLRKILDSYEVRSTPGTIFEQHPIRLPAGRAQRTLFPVEETAEYTSETMDMYLPKICVWEMKAPSETDLQKHHPQVLRYWARVRARYMVLCNFHEFWIYDTNEDDGQLLPKVRFGLEDLPDRADALLFLRGEEPDLSARTERVTAEVARLLGRIVRAVVQASKDPDRDRDRIAKFVLQCVFAMFAEDTDLVPKAMFSAAMDEAVDKGRIDPIRDLFDDFGRKDGAKRHPLAPYVDGPLFDRTPLSLNLSPAHLNLIRTAAKDFDWHEVRPEVFGSIFEQALDPVERHELGAHFTREADIARVVEPTVIIPWRQRIDSLRTSKEAERLIDQMRGYHVLDPACGCGNFLYVVYREMKRLEAALARKWYDLERKVAKRRADVRPTPERPWFTIHQLHGIEKDGFAAHLARVVIWIGEQLAKQEFSLDEETLPLKKLENNIRHGDALHLPWPRPDGELAIVSNPPYLGVRKMRQEFGDEYVEDLFARFAGYPANRAADYVTYWYTQALKVLRPGERAGYVSTNSVAQNESREASIDQILARGGTITDAWKSYPWPGEAAVHIGIVNWVMGPHEGEHTLDGRLVETISPSLTSSRDVTAARHIKANEGLCFMGVTPGNSGFVLNAEEREEILAADRTSRAVIRPFLVGRDVNREVDQQPTRWIVDFVTIDKADAARYSGAFRYVQKHVYPMKRGDTDRKTAAEKGRWWQFVRPRPDLREAIADLKHVLVLPRVSPHLIVSRQPASTCFDGQLMVVALDDYYHFGILQARLHAIWARARGSTLEERLRYTNTTIFETFPFPFPAPDRGTYDPRVRPRSWQADRVAQTAEEFDRLRTATCKERGQGLTKIHNDLEAGKPSPLFTAYEAMNAAVTSLYDLPKDTWRDGPKTLSYLLDLNQAAANPRGSLL